MSNLTKKISDIPTGTTESNPVRHENQEPVKDEKVFNYNHVLDPGQIKQGYSLHLFERPAGTNPTKSKFRINAIHNGQHIGEVMGFINENGKLELHSDLHKDHLGKGLGKAMYEGVLAHAFHHGYDELEGGPHSDAAYFVHKSLARKHGLNYHELPEPAVEGWAQEPYRRIKGPYPHPGYNVKLT